MKDPVIIVGLDCPRTDIWRNELFDSYKANILGVIYNNTNKSLFVLSGIDNFYNFGWCSIV